MIVNYSTIHLQLHNNHSHNTPPLYPSRLYLPNTLLLCPLPLQPPSSLLIYPFYLYIFQTSGCKTLSPMRWRSDCFNFVRLTSLCFASNHITQRRFTSSTRFLKSSSLLTYLITSLWQQHSKAFVILRLLTAKSPRTCLARSNWWRPRRKRWSWILDDAAQPTMQQAIPKSTTLLLSYHLPYLSGVSWSARVQLWSLPKSLATASSRKYGLSTTSQGMVSTTRITPMSM